MNSRELGYDNQYLLPKIRSGSLRPRRSLHFFCLPRNRWSNFHWYSKGKRYVLDFVTRFKFCKKFRFCSSDFLFLPHLICTYLIWIQIFFGDVVNLIVFVGLWNIWSMLTSKRKPRSRRKRQSSVEGKCVSHRLVQKK